MVKRTGKVATWPAICALGVLLAPIPWTTLPERSDPIALDRWLVSEPFAAETEGAPKALEGEYLEALASPGLLPDRDVELGGAYWHLVRDDSSAALDLDARFPERPPVAVAYAHAYIRSPEDRTVRLRWRAPECGAARLRLNAEPLVPAGGDEMEPQPRADGERAMAIRLGAGWNTLLAEVAAGDCPFRLEARLERAAALSVETAETTPGLVGVRVQASRPPAMHRTFPRAFVTAADPAVATPFTWEAGREELGASLRLELAAWGAPAPVVARARAERAAEEGEERPRRRPPVAPPGGPAGGEAAPDSEPERLAALRRRLLPAPPPPEPAPERAELELEAGGRDVDRVVELEGPGRARLVTVSLSLEEVADAARSGRIEGRLRWRVEGDDRRVEGRLPLTLGLDPDQLEGPIVLTGWAEEEGARAGEWRVPGRLAGRSLRLVARDLPGRYTVDGRSVEPDADGLITLCEGCERGRRIRLAVVPAGEWTGNPAVVAR